MILDCIWFCHSKKVRIPGTEDMAEYKRLSLKEFDRAGKFCKPTDAH